MSAYSPVCFSHGFPLPAASVQWPPRLLAPSIIHHASACRKQMMNLPRPEGEQNRNNTKCPQMQLFQKITEKNIVTMEFRSKKIVLAECVFIAPGLASNRSNRKRRHRLCRANEFGLGGKQMTALLAFHRYYSLLLFHRRSGLELEHVMAPQARLGVDKKEGSVNTSARRPFSCLADASFPPGSPGWVILVFEALPRLFAPAGLNLLLLCPTVKNYRAILEIK